MKPMMDKKDMPMMGEEMKAVLSGKKAAKKTKVVKVGKKAGKACK